MKRRTFVAVVLSLFAAGCDSNSNPTTPTVAGQVTLASQLAGTNEVPPATAPEAGGTGTVAVTMVPATGGAYTATFSIQIAGLVKSGVLPAPLDSGTVIVAGHIHSGNAGVAGPAVVPLPISQAAPIVTPTGSAVLAIQNVAVSADVAAAILANPGGYYFNLHSALNPGGVVRGQLARQ